MFARKIVVHSENLLKTVAPIGNVGSLKSKRDSVPSGEISFCLCRLLVLVKLKKMCDLRISESLE